MNTYISQNQTVIVDGEVYSLTDKEKFPIIDNFSLEDILFLDKIDDNYREKYFNYYNFYGMGVPRVTHILEASIDRSGLIHWAANIGKQEMARVKKEAQDIGSRVHEMIENYLKTGEDLDISYKTPRSYLNKVLTSYFNFKSWILWINSNKYFIEEIIAIEHPVICSLYGGTIDCIMKINGKVYIVDFKTSKSISYEYILQTCSYYWAVNAGYAPDLPHIDGIGIIRIDKEKPIFEDLFLNEHIPYQREILNSYILGWGSILASYYNNINMKLLFSDFRKQYKKKGTID